MTCRDTEQPRVLSRTTGRLRLHLPALAEAELRRLPGVREVKANPLTGNMLIRFDPGTASAEGVLEAAGAVAAGLQPADSEAAESAGYKPAATRGQALLQAGLRGLVGHALVDTAFYALVFTEPFGLPLTGLGALHLGLDLVVWTVALAPVLEESAA
jgi:hypothetical protein